MEKPITRKETYLQAIASGDKSDLPAPITREEMLLYEIAFTVVNRNLTKLNFKKNVFNQTIKTKKIQSHTRDNNRNIVLLLK